ncbi:IS66 family insertion sequence element accessory protein TnpA [Slackia isoflavoniconvertens]|uniref:Transposase n=1 Tax=Slackia isoflavoniconvertens TaxID=572010 RepID=A0A369LE90_9ACTN|nr:hypothetical protein [Slackia isoflavoniconvertens]RDB56536.1 hypothetical protein C1881_08390 [Slackia isoflavoniconvertens]
MSANGDAARRDMWAGRIERCLAADMTVKEWCALNKVAESGLCKWMTRFREEEPRPLFPQVERGVELDEDHASRPRRRRCEPVFRSRYGGKVTAGILSEVKKLMMKR